MFRALIAVLECWNDGLMGEFAVGGMLVLITLGSTIVGLLVLAVIAVLTVIVIHLGLIRVLLIKGCES